MPNFNTEAMHDLFSNISFGGGGANGGVGKGGNAVHAGGTLGGPSATVSGGNNKSSPRSGNQNQQTAALSLGQAVGAAFCVGSAAMAYDGKNGVALGVGLAGCVATAMGA